MDSDLLLNSDYNAKYYETCYQTKRIVNLPHGKIGIEIEIMNDIPTIVEISNKCKIKNKLHIGDEIYSINDEILVGKSAEDIELLFYRNIIGPRKCVIYTDYI
tara:strand:+ start:276 stop:584 length:309 start_codon:yes stop_codon:yes gene_type:complete